MKETCYKTIFFDWNKTLSYSNFWQQLEDKSHPHHKEGEKICQFLFNGNRALINPWMRGTTDTQHIVTKISEGTDISHTLILKQLEEGCRNMVLVPDGIIDLIQKAHHQGINCVIATDNMDTFREYTIPSMKLEDVFDDFLISNELETLKFDVDKKNRKIPFFDKYLKKHDLKYKDVVLLDDCVDDGFYNNVGFKIVQINKPIDVKSFMEHLTS